MKNSCSHSTQPHSHDGDEKPHHYWNPPNKKSFNQKQINRKNRHVKNQNPPSMLYLNPSSSTVLPCPAITKSRPQSAPLIRKSTSRYLNNITSPIASRIPSITLLSDIKVSEVNHHCLVESGTTISSSIGLHKLKWPTSVNVVQERKICRSTLKPMYFQARQSVMLSKDGKFCSILDFKSLTPNRELVRKFKSLLRLVRVVVKIRCLIQKCEIKQKETESNPQTLAELNYYSHNAEFATRTLVFNKLDFIQSASTITVPLWARLVMEKDSSLRTSEDLKKLATLFRCLKSFCESFSDEKQDSFCKHCQYMCVDKRRLVLRAGHQAFFSYLIFSGSLFVNIEDSETGGKRYYRTAAVLQKGDLFGDLSLIHNLPRSANYITRERTELIVLDKEFTVNLLAAGINKELSIKTYCIRKHEIFSDWSDEMIEVLAKYCEIVKYPFNSVIELDTSCSEFIYMILEGNIEMLIQSTIDNTIVKPTNNPDYFADIAVYQRTKQPNQCSLYCSKNIPPDHQVFISLELLFPYSICDLHSLSSTSSHPLILISHNSRVLKIPKHYLQTLPTNYSWRHLLRKVKNTPRYPSQEVLQQLHQEHVHWERFKSFIVQRIVSEINGECLAMKPKYSKGEKCGWTNSSKQQSAARGKNDDQFKKCLSFEIPLCYHGSERHHSSCILNYTPPVTRLTYDQKLAISLKD